MVIITVFTENDEYLIVLTCINNSNFQIFIRWNTSRLGYCIS